MIISSCNTNSRKQILIDALGSRITELTKQVGRATKMPTVNNLQNEISVLQEIRSELKDSIPRGSQS